MSRFVVDANMSEHFESEGQVDLWRITRFQELSYVGYFGSCSLITTLCIFVAGLEEGAALLLRAYAFREVTHI